MGNRKSTENSTSNKTDQTSVQSKGTLSRRRNTIQMVQNIRLIWLDNKINDKNSTDCRKAISQLRVAVNTMNTFTDSEECIRFLENITDNKVLMIISGSVGHHIISRIHNISHVDSIFIYSNNKIHHEQWMKDWSKIKGVFMDVLPICEILQEGTQQYEQNSISISFVTTNNNICNKKLDQLDPTFMYTQILKEILLTIQFEQKHFQEFIDHFRVMFLQNKRELKIIDKLQKKYHKKTPIWWYTYDCFLYPTLNHALRLMNIDIIIKMGFFIDDLHRQIEQLHSEQLEEYQSKGNFIVYRGQSISKFDFNRMIKTKGGLISFNNFLSTSKDQNISLIFARRALLYTDMIGIVFVMKIDPTKRTIPFASIINVSFYKSKEDEVLFSMHTIFRIDEIISIDKNHRLFQVELTLINDNDNDLRLLTEHIRQETFPNEKGWQRLGLLLNKIGQFIKSQQVFQILLEQTNDNNEKGILYERLGIAKHNQGEYKEALEFYEKSSEIRQKFLHSNHPDLATSYSNIGVVYYNMGNYSKALLSYEKALKIQEFSLPSNHPDLAKTYIAHGLIYNEIGEHLKAIELYKKAIKIQEESLPLNHPDLGMSYNNMGNAYYKMNDYLKALSSYKNSFEIKYRSLPKNHPDLGVSYNNIGSLYFTIGDHLNAYLFYEHAVYIGQCSLSSNNQNFQLWKNNLERVKKFL